MEVHNRDVGKRFREFLKKKRLKQKQLGKELRLSQQTISSYCRNGKIPHHILIVLKTIFGLDVDWLLSGEKKDGLSQENNQQTFVNTQNLLNIYKKLNEYGQACLLRYGQVLEQHLSDKGSLISADFYKKPMVEVPFLGMMKKNEAIPQIKSWDGSRAAIPTDILVGNESEEYFCFQSKDDALEKGGICPDDYVVFRKKNTAEQGKMVQVEVKEKIFLARIFFLDDAVELRLIAPKSEVVRLSKAEAYRIEGVMVGIYRTQLF